MALTTFPDISKHITLEDGTGYAYVIVAAAPSKPTFLLLHGFPSTSYDWRHQISSLSAKGYGVVAPDLLGYGDTDSPSVVEAYSLKRMSDHIAEILKNENIKSVIGVGHDWGSGLLSRFYTWHPEYLAALVFISVGYIEPTDKSVDVDGVNELTKSIFGYSIFGYWKFFNTVEAAKVLENNPSSVTSLLYPEDPETWKEHLGPVDAAKSWITAGKTTARASWLTQEEIDTHEAVIAKRGYAGGLNWYKCAIAGIDVAHDAKITEEEKHVQLPTLLIATDQDYVTRADLQVQETAKWIKKLEVKKLPCGHWPQLEQPDKVNQLLDEFVKTI